MGRTDALPIERVRYRRIRLASLSVARDPVAQSSGQNARTSKAHTGRALLSERITSSLAS
jgi:hypothetical protein